MKINFQVSQITNLDANVIKGLIQLKLKDGKYDVTDVTDNIVKFYDSPWVLRWNFQQIGRLDGGSFIISSKSVTLKYYLNLWQPLIGVSIPVIGTAIAGAYEGTIFFIAFIIIALCIQTAISRNVARDMLTSLLNEDGLTRI